MVEFNILDANPKENSEAILRLLTECDKDFLPYLSSRRSTTQKFNGLINNENDSDGIEDYYEGILKQKLIVAESDGCIYGFLSYISDYETEACPEYSPANYVSTIMVSKTYRRLGLARKMYLKLIAESKGLNIETRTWSTNENHINLLDELGFNEIRRLKNDRGKGVDTVYYGKKC